MNRIVKIYVWKVFLVFLIVLVYSQSFAQTSERPRWGPKSERNETDEMGRKQGVWRSYFPTGEIRLEVNYLNNLIDGLYKRYYYGNKVREEINYLAGKKDGDYLKYYLSGQPSLDGKYALGKKDGKWTAYYESGQVKYEGEYKAGIKEGRWVSYNLKGVITSDITYKNGVDVNAAPPVPPKAKQGKVIAPVPKKK